jgi:mannonate dehydratase
LKITSAKVIVSCPGRNFVTLKIETASGIYGIGDATLNGRELAVVAYLEEHVLPCLIGQDAGRIEDIWQYLYRGAYWRRGPVTMTAIAAVDVALWDIKAKAANMPLYQLLGGRSREKILVYCHANGKDLDDCLKHLRKYRDEGYKAIRVQCGVPGFEKIYGISKSKLHYEPAEKGLPPEEVWSTPEYLAYMPSVFAAARKEVGDSIHLLHDCHHRLTPIEAARLGKDLEPYRLFWIEDPTPAENQEAFKYIREHTTTPIAVGEVFSSIHECKDLIENHWIDYIRSTIVHTGGITHLRQIAALASLYKVKTGFHGATDLSPVTMAAALHFDTWVPNFGIQEYMVHSPLTLEVFKINYRCEDGYMYIDDTPGHGVDIDETKASRYPYERAYLPVNRLTDGSMWDW